MRVCVFIQTKLVSRFSNFKDQLLKRAAHLSSGAQGEGTTEGGQAAHQTAQGAPAVAQDGSTPTPAQVCV
jgi:hypothetical protein